MQEVNIEKEPLLRLIILGRKSLPDSGEKSKPFWGFVELVTTNIHDVKDVLRERMFFFFLGSTFFKVGSSRKFE